MINLKRVCDSLAKELRADPERYRRGAEAKNIQVDFDRLLAIDAQYLAFEQERQTLKTEQNKLGKEIGPQIGKLKGQLKKRGGDVAVLEAEIATLEAKPAGLKQDIQRIEKCLNDIEPEWIELLLQVPQPPDPDVPPGQDAEDNVELRAWHPPAFDPARSFADNRGFPPRSHETLLDDAGLLDVERAVKISGARHYVLRGDAMRLHHALLRFAFDTIIDEHGFEPVSVPVIVREECMVGTGFFPGGQDQAYHVEETARGSGHDLFLTGTGEVGLMGLHADELIDGATLPRKYATVSTCFRREAGAAGKDTAGLYRIHQFDKVEQVVICRADEAESRRWHQTMIGIVETLLQKLELPYRLLQCCTGDLGAKNADMIDIECWMPSRGEVDASGHPTGAYGETHSASRLYDFQCRRLNLRYKDENGKNVVCHSLNNTVAASPRLLIPLIEIHQQQDGSIHIPPPLRPYMGGLDVMRPRG